MRTGPKQKGVAVSPTQGRTRNQPGNVAKERLRGPVTAPGASVGRAGNTRNQPKTAPVPKAEIGKGVPNSYFANSRTAVHKNFDRHPHD